MNFLEMLCSRTASIVVTHHFFFSSFNDNGIRYIIFIYSSLAFLFLLNIWIWRIQRKRYMPTSHPHPTMPTLPPFLLHSWIFLRKTNLKGKKRQFIYWFYDWLCKVQNIHEYQDTSSKALWVSMFFDNFAPSYSLY